MNTIKNNEWEEITKGEMNKDSSYEYKEITKYIDNKNYCYDSIKKLYDRGLEQTNIHILVSEETIGQIYETFSDYINKEPRLKGLNAIVLLSLKTKGRGESFTQLSQEKFTKLVNTALDNNIPIGFDSCSQIAFINSIKNRKNFKQLEILSEPCESAKFSAYVDCKGDFYPCSFTEKTTGWENGIHVPDCKDYRGFWDNKRTVKFRNNVNKCLKKGIPCQIYNITH